MRKLTADQNNRLNLFSVMKASLMTLCLLLSMHTAHGFGTLGDGDDDDDGGDEDTSSSRQKFDNTSDTVKSCEQLLGKPWRTYATSFREKKTFIGVNGVLTDLETNLPEILKDQLKLEENSTLPTALTDKQVRSIAQVFNHLPYCEAYAATLDPDNYGNGANAGEFEERESKPSMGAHGLPCLNQSGAAQQQCLMQAQSQKPLKCVNKKNETHDYIQCKKILNFIDGFAIGKQVMQMQQTYRAGDHQLDLQQDYLKKVNSGEAGVTDAMAVQRDSLEKQASLAYEMAVFDAAKAATLLSLIDNAPRPGSYTEEHCTPTMTQLNSNLDALMTNALKEVIGGDSEATKTANLTKAKDAVMEKLKQSGFPYESDICERAIGTASSPNNIFMRSNQEVFDQVKGLAIKAGLEALANGAKGALLNKQADMIDDAMKDVQEFEPPEFPVVEAVEATASECLVDPNAEGCIAPNGTGFDGFRDQGFSATIGGSANLGSDNGRGTLDDSETALNGATGPDRSLIPNDFGVVQQAGQSDNSFSGGPARAGSIKAGELAAGGGGGGGGAGGGGGGLGGGPARGPANKKAPSGKKDIKIKTSGTGLGVVGGRGRIGAKKQSKASNPFSKLLGKNSKSGNSTLNFRGPAQLGSKKGSLFQMISNRYSDVQSKDRLLKYEAERGN